jgi:hypothetical protein
MIQLNREEVAWAAGLFEGEGCITGRIQKGGKTPDMFLQVVSTDEDVVRHFHNVVRLGSVRGPIIKKVGYKPCWEWRARGFQPSQAILAWFWPFLHARRRAKARQQLHDSAQVRTRKGLYIFNNVLCSVAGCGKRATSNRMCQRHDSISHYKSKGVQATCAYCGVHYVKYTNRRSEFCSFRCKAQAHKCWATSPMNKPGSIHKKVA